MKDPIHKTSYAITNPYHKKGLICTEQEKLSIVRIRQILYASALLV